MVVMSNKRGQIYMKTAFYTAMHHHHHHFLLWNVKELSHTSRLIREGNGTPLQYSCLENPMDRGAWKAAVHGVTKSQTRLSDFPFTFTFMHWRRKWQPTPVFLPGESQGWGSLVGCHLWGRTESDTCLTIYIYICECEYIYMNIYIFYILFNYSLL